ncbi:4Fe-4S Mo/W bis-MGD-type domain-containing protein [Cupriavidus necator]|uniref:Uncharacterized protein n=1 Tax=Cupriavidus necator (strain ATCC 17699 / DSM 428 / KCTC 22496 / NCIMB 10442 / H16 / Stanier 337) TaxID=381666 RepID=A0AAE5ZLQ1_CUPNH|nr:hypothetical protein [Cupriavidus necator]QCC03978.1 hypothetical protein E6A55_25880 [Cupriavidus necator H16]QQB81038.1 hypothetical protein I6H87_25460 [Cupriavidus necator]WKA42873.1 hypothetical protein QWP09_25925 [Cupriavidus necator]
MTQCTCPVCGQGARWSPMKNGRVCINCTAPGCGIQLFARSDEADERIRERFILGDGVPYVRNVTETMPATPGPGALEQGELSVWG